MTLQRTTAALVLFSLSIPSGEAAYGGVIFGFDTRLTKRSSHGGGRTQLGGKHDPGRDDSHPKSDEESSDGWRVGDDAGKGGANDLGGGSGSTSGFGDRGGDGPRGAARSTSRGRGGSSGGGGGGASAGGWPGAMGGTAGRSASSGSSDAGSRHDGHDSTTAANSNGNGGSGATPDGHSNAGSPSGSSPGHPSGGSTGSDSTRGGTSSTVSGWLSRVDPLSAAGSVPVDWLDKFPWPHGGTADDAGGKLPTPPAVPEPSSAVLLGLALAGLWWRRLA